MSDFGLRISQQGSDVNTCPKDELILDSDLRALQGAKVGNTSSSVAHGLSYTPIYFAMSKISSTKFGIVGQNYFSGLPSCDNTNFNSNGGGSSESKYYIFYQEGAGA